MLFDSLLSPAHQLIHRRESTELWLRMGEWAAWGCLIYIINTPTDDEQQNQGFMTGLESYTVQTIYVTVVNVLNTPIH